MTYCVWFILLNIKIFKVHLHCSMYQYFILLWINNIPLWCVYHSLLIHASVDEHLGCFKIIFKCNLSDIITLTYEVACLSFVSLYHWNALPLL